MIDFKKIEENERKFRDSLNKLKEEFSEEKVVKDKVWEKTVNALLVEGDKVLMIKRVHQPFKNTWALPGGHIDVGETDVKAIIREVKEETGLDFKPVYFGSYEERFEEMEWYAYVSTFSGKFKGVLKKGDNTEISDISWFKFNELKDVKIGFEHRKIIEEYFALQ